MSLFLSVVLFILSLFSQGTDTYLDLPTPAGACIDTQVVLRWNDVTARNVWPITVTGWANSTTFTAGPEIVFYTHTDTVKVGDPYTIVVAGRQINKTLPFSWQCQPTATPLPTTTPTPTGVPTSIAPKTFCRLWLDSDQPNQPVYVNFDLVGVTPLRYDGYTCGQHILLRIGQSELTEFYTWGESGIQARQPETGSCFLPLPPVK